MYFFQVKDTLYKFWVLNFRLRDWGRDRSDNNSRSSKHGLHSCRIFEPKLNEDFRDSGGGGGGGKYVFSIFFKRENDKFKKYQIVLTRVIYHRIWNRKKYFEIMF